MPPKFSRAAIGCFWALEGVNLVTYEIGYGEMDLGTDMNAGSCSYVCTP